MSICINIYEYWLRDDFFETLIEWAFEENKKRRKKIFFFLRFNGKEFIYLL